MTDGISREPTSARIADVAVGHEFADFLGALGFYIACGLLGLLPRSVGGPILARFVAFAASYDEGHAR